MRKYCARRVYVKIPGHKVGHLAPATAIRLVLVNIIAMAADSLGDRSADSDQTCTFQCVIPINRRPIKTTIGVVMNHLVGMAL